MGSPGWTPVDESAWTPVDEPSQGTAPPPENVIRPAETGPKSFTENLMSDIEQGTTITPVGRFLRSLGAQGTRSGVSGATGAMVGGPLEAIPRLLHGDIQSATPGHRIEGLNEIMQGTGQALAPVAGVTSPSFLPAAVGFGLTQQGVQTGAQKLGISPETSQFIGNLAGMAALGAAPSVPGLIGARGTPAERLSAAMSMSLGKKAWANANENLQALDPQQISSVVGGAKNMAEVSAKMKARSFELGDQFSKSIADIKDNDVTSQVNKLRANLEQGAINDPNFAAQYSQMAGKLENVKTLGQLDDLVSGFNKTKQWNGNPQSMVRQALTETVRDLTGKDFSGLRLEQSRWMNLSQKANVASLPAQVEAMQQRVTSPVRKGVQAAGQIPTSSAKAVLFGMKQFNPSAESLIQSIQQGPPAGEFQVPMNTEQYPKAGAPVTPEEFRERVGAINDPFTEMRGQPSQMPVGPSLDPELARHEANMRMRAEEASRNPVQTTLYNAQPTTTSTENIPKATSYFDRYGRLIQGEEP